MKSALDVVKLVTGQLIVASQEIGHLTSANFALRWDTGLWTVQKVSENIV